MTTRRLLCLIPFAFLLVLAACAGKKTASYKGPPLPGEYRVVGPYHRTVDKKPEVIEVFAFESEASYRITGEMDALKKRYEERVRFRSVPIFWGDHTPFAAKLYFIAAEADREWEVRRALFEAKFVEGRDLRDQEVVARVAAKHGLGELYAAKLFSTEINRKCDEADALVKEYNLTATPSVVVNRSLLVTPQIAGGTVEDMVASLKTMLAGIIGW